MLIHHLPECAPEWGCHRESWEILRLVEGPVVRGKRAGEDHLAESHNEVHDPEPHEELEDLEVDGVSVGGKYNKMEDLEVDGVSVGGKHNKMEDLEVDGVSVEGKYNELSGNRWQAEAMLC